MYGSMMDSNITEKDASRGEEHPLVTKNDSAISMPEEFKPKAFLKNPFGETFDADFWKEVTELFGDGKGKGWNEALNEVRLRHIKKGFEVDGKDCLVTLMTEVFNKYKQHSPDDQRMASFKQQLTAFAEKILKDDEKDQRYKNLLPVGNIQCTILHLAAENNLLDIVKGYVAMYPNSVYITRTDDKLALELALTARIDDVASFLMSKMFPARVRDLFQSDDTFPARFRFVDIINDPSMTKTVVHLLDACINPDWPFTPVKEGEEKEAWSKMPDTSVRYHFYYRLLDGDLNSEPPKINGEINPEFDNGQRSCLQVLSGSTHGQIAMYHPVVRKLVDVKWEKFGRKKIMSQLLIYVLFLVFMSCALFIKQDSNVSKPVRTSKTVFEIITLLFALGYLVIEFDEMEKERLEYWSSPYNYLDLLGLILIFVLIPLRFTNSLNAEYGVGAVAYLINCLRVFKYLPAWKTVGIYCKTFAHIIYYDITKFALVYVIVMLAFGGSVYLSLSAISYPKLSLKEIFLREFRAIAEGNPFDDSYDAYYDGIVFLLMANMFVIIVILSNILIGQLSYRYELAINEAETQYSIDKTKFICRLENNRFRFLSSRIDHYMEGDYLCDKQQVKALLADWKEKKAELED